MGYIYTTRPDSNVLGGNVILRKFSIEQCWHLVARVRPKTGLSFYRITDADEKKGIEDFANKEGLL